jgi:hypothetical protein
VAVEADTEVVVDMVAVEVSTEGAEAFMVAWAEVDFVPADFAEAGHTLRAEALGAADSAEVTAAMVVDTVTTITDQVL